MKNYSICKILLISILFLGVFPSCASKSNTGVDYSQMSEQEIMEIWMKANAKNEHHENFKDMVGTWSIENKMWMDPSGEPQISEASAKYKLVMDGRFLMQEYNGDFGGMPFSGIGLEGYDTVTNQFMNIWIDSMTNGMFLSKGHVQEDGTVLYTGSMPDPMNPEVGKEYEMIIRKISKRKFIFEMYEFGDDGKYKSMEMTYSKV